MALYPEYSQNLPRLVSVASTKYPDLRLIDVGANVGDTAWFVRAVSGAPILCVEGNPDFFTYLRQNTRNLQGVEIEESFLGDDESSDYALISKEGTARLAAAPPIPGVGAIRTRPLDDVLADHQAFSSAKVLKSDTDGFEGSVLRGASVLLQEAKPIIFVEFDPALFDRQGQTSMGFIQQMTDLGYSRALVYDAFGYLMFGLSLDQRDVLEGLVAYLRHKKGLPYVDLAVFHECDRDLYSTCLAQEKVYYETHHRWDG
jgi:FkbM family methyltransferase